MSKTLKFDTNVEMCEQEDDVASCSAGLKALTNQITSAHVFFSELLSEAAAGGLSAQLHILF